MTTTVKAASAAEFLSLVPRMLGFRPSDSLVLIPFDGSRSLGAMRVDLPRRDVDDPPALEGAASTLLGMMCRVPHADGFAMVVYTEVRFADEGEAPHRRLIQALERHADSCGVRVTDALCVAPDAWGSYLDPLSPDTGRPLSDLDWEPEAISDLPEPDADQRIGSTLPEIAAIDQQAADRASRAFAAAVEVVCGPDAATTLSTTSTSTSTADPAEDRRVDPQALAAVCALDDLPGLFEDALSWDAASLPPFDAAMLGWCLARPSLRDVALVQWSGSLSSGDDALAAQLRWEAGEEYPTHLAMRMWGEGDQPDPERLQRALDLVRHVAALAPRELKPGALSTAAWLSWALGRSTHAEQYALHACEIDPEHGLAEIVLSFVGAGHLPDWAFRSQPGRGRSTRVI